MAITVRINADRLRRLALQIPSRSRASVDETANNVRDLARNLAPRDTGSLIASLYVSNGEASDYSQSAAAARGLNHDAVIVPEVRPEFVVSPFGSTPNAYLVVVGAAVAHGLFQEYGTAHMGAQPFLTPAVEAERANFQASMSRVADV